MERHEGILRDGVYLCIIMFKNYGFIEGFPCPIEEWMNNFWTEEEEWIKKVAM